MHDESIMLVLKKTNKKIIKMLSNRYKEMNLDITPNQSKILMFIYNNKYYGIIFFHFLSFES